MQSFQAGWSNNSQLGRQMAEISGQLWPGPDPIKKVSVEGLITDNTQVPTKIWGSCWVITDRTETVLVDIIEMYKISTVLSLA